MVRLQPVSTRALLAAAVCFGTSAVALADREFPDSAFYMKADAANQKGLEALVGKPMPALQLADWIGTEVKPDDMKGKVVVIDIWATWCGPCKAAIPHTNEMLKKYAKDGLVVVGVCSSDDGQEDLPKVAKDKKIEYPVAKDPDSKTAKAFNVSFFPTFVVVDRTGKVRAAGLSPDGVESVVKKLLAEKATS